MLAILAPTGIYMLLAGLVSIVRMTVGPKISRKDYVMSPTTFGFCNTHSSMNIPKF